MYKCFVTLILAFAIFVYADYNQDLINLEERFIKNMNICVTQTNVTLAEIDEIIQLHVPTDNPALCFMACMAKRFNIMDADNKFSKSEIKSLLEPIMLNFKNQGQEIVGYTIMNIINESIDQQTSEKDECVAAKNAMTSVVAYAKKIGLLQ